MPGSEFSRKDRLRHWISVAGADLLLQRAVPGPVASGAVAGPEEELKALAERLKNCTACALHAGRTQMVFADGDPKADIFFIGEAPGRDEDRQGLPFVGRAGQLLTRIIENAMGLRREDVYIANVVKCRPPANRNPLPDEQGACGPNLAAQIRLVQPKILICLGGVAAQHVLDCQTPVGRLRGRLHSRDDGHGEIPVVVTWHPAYLLRNPSAKQQTWDDIRLALRTLDLPETPRR